MYCPKCGLALDREDLYCPSCGYKQGQSSDESSSTLTNINYQLPPLPSESIEKQTKKATASFVLGLISLLAWFLPIIGFPVAIVGLVMGIKGIQQRKDYAKAGVVLNTIGLVLTTANAAIGAYMGYTGFY